MTSAKDTLFDSAPASEEPPFEFNDAVARVFPDMLQRSIPGYETTLSTIGAMAGRFAQADSCCYDLGCSLGAAAVAMREAVKDPSVSVVGIDSAPAMVKRASQNLASYRGPGPIHIELADITRCPLDNASVVVLNFTLQFVPVEQRAALMDRIASALMPGGVLLLSEKIAYEDAASDTLFSDLYHAFKRSQGYSQLEIARKRNALETVLVRESLATHRQRLLGAGFSRVEQWFQCFNFASLVAFK